MPEDVKIKIPTIQSDSAWKDVLNVWFKEFMEFFYPELAKKIDWSAGYETLDKELQKVGLESKSGKRFVDKLIKVQSIEGEEFWVLLHIEVQGTKQNDFEKRLFGYYYRLYDRYGMPIVTLVVLTDSNPTWRPSTYRSTVWGKEILHFQFFTVKLLDYVDQYEVLAESKNPFCIIVLAQLAALKTGNKTQKAINNRFVMKRNLTRMLYDGGLDRDGILSLYKFIDFVLTLPKDLEIRYNDYIHEIEEERTMTYITTAERIGMEKGYQLGIEKGKEQAETYITTAERTGMEKGYQLGIKESEERAKTHITSAERIGMEKGYQLGIKESEERAKTHITSAERIGMEKGYQLGIKESEERAKTHITSAERIGMEKGYQLGIEKGIETGIEKGIEKGLGYEKILFHKLLSNRFGNLSAAMLAKLKQADHNTLLLWGDRIFNAKTIEDVFSEKENITQ